MSADPLRIGQTPTPAPTSGVPAPGVWVVEIHGYDQESGDLDTHSVSVHPDRAHAVAWVDAILGDVRHDFDEDWHPEVTEYHEQEGEPETWTSTWAVASTYDDGEPYLTLTVRQARFGYAYTAF